MIKHCSDSEGHFQVPLAFRGPDVDFCEGVTYGETKYDPAEALSPFQRRRFQQVFEKYQYIQLNTLAYQEPAVRWLLKNDIPFGLDVVCWEAHDGHFDIYIDKADHAMLFKLAWGGR